MKKALKKTGKILLIIILIWVLLSAASVVYIYMGVNFERRYKDLFDKTFDGNYTVTVNDKGKGEGRIDLPYLYLPIKYKEYDIKYFDKDGNERHMEIIPDDFCQMKVPELPALPLVAYKKSHNADFDVEHALALQSASVFMQQMSELLPEYFGSETSELHSEDSDDSKYIVRSRYFSYDGYNIRIYACDGAEFVAASLGWDSIPPKKEGRDYFNALISPDTCNVISQQDIKSFVSRKTAYYILDVDIYDEALLDKAGELEEKAQALLDEINSYSEHGGNYILRTRKVKKAESEEEYDEYEEVLSYKPVIFGEEIELSEDGSYLKELKKANGAKID